MVRTKRLVCYIVLHVVLIATFWSCHRFVLCNSWCMSVQQQVASYPPCPIIGKWSFMQMALNSYRLMCMESTVKGFPSEFLHQTLAKTFNKRLLRTFRRKLVVIFHCSTGPTSFHCKKASKTKAFMEKLRCPTSIQGLICQPLGNTCLEMFFVEIVKNL